MLFKVNENLPVDIAETLRGAGYDVMTIVDQQMAGEVAAVCYTEQRSLVTRLRIRVGSTQAVKFKQKRHYNRTINVQVETYV